MKPENHTTLRTHCIFRQNGDGVYLSSVIPM